MSDDINKRIVDLEIRYTHQEEMVSQLNEIVTSQARAIEKLSADLEKLKLASNASDTLFGSEKPPHY